MLPGRDGGEVKVTKPALTLENDTLTLDFKFNMEAVKVNSTQSYAFTPVLFAGKNYKTLPPVVVTGKSKFKMRHKDRKLAKKGYYNAAIIPSSKVSLPTAGTWWTIPYAFPTKNG